jgi:hypothetical protein
LDEFSPEIKEAASMNYTGVSKFMNERVRKFDSLLMNDLASYFQKGDPCIILGASSL